MQFRAETADGKYHELEADSLQAAIETLEGQGYLLERITSVWYFNGIYQQWQSADNLLLAYKTAKTTGEE